MNNEKDSIKIGKFLSLVLRHHPETIGIELDENGWTDVKTLISQINQKGLYIDMTILKHIVDTNSKKRYAFNETFDRIRANQGHSVNIDLGYPPQKPPEILFHGTAQKSVEAILANGLEKRERHHVHLSSDIESAINVGKRHGKPFVFQVFTGQMYKEQYVFYLSENGVWLTDCVPSKYLKSAF